MTLEGESRWGDKPSYGGRLRLPSGRRWIGNEDGFPADELGIQDHSSRPPLGEPPERSYYRLFGGGKPNLEI